MKLLSKELVSLDYRQQLQQDLARATVCRFLVAYISGSGIDSIGRHLLKRVLGEPRSFGVGSLSCSCGYKPLLQLQRELGDSTPRLKYFMDPVVQEKDEPGDLALFHSKLVYLALERERKSVIYLGSHNWTRRALGPGGPRNAEASLRFEMDYAPEHLDGTGPSLASEVNRHLREAYDLAACLPATAGHEATFRQWCEKACGHSQGPPLQQVTLVLAVRKSGEPPATPQRWQALTDQGIYFQILEEEEGNMVWRSNDRLLVLVWNSEEDLREAHQPILLRCRITTAKAGPGSSLHGTNQSTHPVVGFQAVVFDEDQLAAMQASARGHRSSVSIWSGRKVEIYDFAFPAQHTDSSQVDGGLTPKYQFHLEVEHVVFPADGACPESPEMVWGRESFAVAKSRKSARYQAVPGYEVTSEVEAAIKDCLTRTLLIEPGSATVLPVSAYDRATVGKRVSAHPLHETFLGEGVSRQRGEFYRKAEPGSLVADLDMPEDAPRRDRPAAAREEPMQRVQRVFTTRLGELQRRWTATAADYRSSGRESDRS
jgi:hypothetical protein